LCGPLSCSFATNANCVGDDCGQDTLCVERGYFGEECFADSACDLEAGPIASVTVIRDESRFMVGDRVYLDSSRCLSASDDELTYRWYFSSVPDESETRIEPESAPSASSIESESTDLLPSFLLDVRGQYQVCLQVCDSSGRCTSPDAEEECHRDFCMWISTDYLGHIVIKATWDHPNGNVDVHYIRSGAVYGDIGAGGDCFPGNDYPGPCGEQEAFHEGNPSPDYCVPGDPLDDPFFANEDNCGYGPEMLVHDNPCDDTYRLWLTYEEDWGRGSTVARVRIYSGDGPPEEPEHLFDGERVLDAEDCHWFVGEVTWAQGRATFREPVGQSYVCGAGNPEE